MAVRTSCFALAIFTEGALRWGLLAGSLILPWVAVVLANASRENSQQGADYFHAAELAASERQTD